MQLTLALSNSLESSYVGKIAFIERRLTELNFGRDLRGYFEDYFTNVVHGLV
jgi:hypothetical protein